MEGEGNGRGKGLSVEQARNNNPGKQRERGLVIQFIMYSQGKEGLADHSGGDVLVIGLSLF